MKYCYSVFGGCLVTDLEFPELRPCSPRDPRWFFEAVDRLPERSQLKEIGDQHIYGDVHARLLVDDAGFRITVDDTGSFDIDATGSRIVFKEREGAWPDFVRAHLLGRVLATAVFSRGWMPLHGSAVLLGEGVVGFLAPKGFGKSSLALALTRSGGRLVTDDTLPIELGNPPRAWPGVHSVRIKTDVLGVMGIGGADLETREGKGIVTSLSDNEVTTIPAPLSAIYLLHPVVTVHVGAGDQKPLVSRGRLRQVPAAVSLLANFKLARMTGAANNPEVLRRAAQIAEVTPVFNLFLPRDLGALSQVADQVREWHGVPAPSESSGKIA